MHQLGLDTCAITDTQFKCRDSSTDLAGIMSTCLCYSTAENIARFNWDLHKPYKHVKIRRIQHLTEKRKFYFSTMKSICQNTHSHNTGHTIQKIWPARCTKYDASNHECYSYYHTNSLSLIYLHYLICIKPLRHILLCFRKSGNLFQNVSL